MGGTWMGVARWRMGLVVVELGMERLNVAMGFGWTVDGLWNDYVGCNRS